MNKRERVSNRMTFCFKYISPSIAYAVGVVFLFLIFENDYPLFAVIILVGLILYGFAFHVYKGYFLKEVWIDDNFVYISNFRKEIKTPFSEVESVDMIKGLGQARVTFKQRTEFGNEVTYVMKFVDLLKFALYFDDADEVPSIKKMKSRITRAKEMSS